MSCMDVCKADVSGGQWNDHVMSFLCDVHISIGLIAHVTVMLGGSADMLMGG